MSGSLRCMGSESRVLRHFPSPSSAEEWWPDFPEDRRSPPPATLQAGQEKATEIFRASPQFALSDGKAADAAAPWPGSCEALALSQIPAQSRGFRAFATADVTSILIFR